MGTVTDVVLISIADVVAKGYVIDRTVAGYTTIMKELMLLMRVCDDRA